MASEEDQVNLTENNSVSVLHASAEPEPQKDSNNNNNNDNNNSNNGESPNGPGLPAWQKDDIRSETKQETRTNAGGSARVGATTVAGIHSGSASSPILGADEENDHSLQSSQRSKAPPAVSWDNETFRKVIILPDDPKYGDVAARTRAAEQSIQNNGGDSSNVVRTTKFDSRPWKMNFLVYGLVYEFLQRRANIYFLFISVIQAVPGISSTGRFNTLITLIVVTAFAVIQSLFEDWKRHKMDAERNSAVSLVWNQKIEDWEEVQRKNIKIGDLIRVDTSVKNGGGIKTGGDHAVGQVGPDGNPITSHHGEIPCDMVILTSSDQSGGCWVETAALDGEARLKPKRCSMGAMISTEKGGMMGMQGLLAAWHDVVLDIEEPTANIHSFVGRIRRVETEEDKKERLNRVLTPETSVSGPVAEDYSDVIPVQDSFTDYAMNEERALPTFEDAGHKGYELTNSNFAPFGGCVKKTEWIIGVACYVGQDTKLMRNRNPVAFKTSGVYKTMNRLLILVLGLEIIVCAICASSLVALDQTRSESWYLVGGEGAQRQDSKGTGEEVLRLFIAFLTFMVLFNNFIPISLYVSLELIRTGQSLLMEADICLYNERIDKRLIVRTSALNEELGQVTHMFCDKTGTLTKNQMAFLKFGVGENLYGRKMSELEKSQKILNGERFVDVDIEQPDALGAPGHGQSASRVKKMPPGFVSTTSTMNSGFNWSYGSMAGLNKAMQDQFEFEDNRMPNLNFHKLDDADRIEDLFRALSLCHSVVQHGPVYESETPDETALVTAAAMFGFRFSGYSDSNSKVMNVARGSAGQAQEFELLDRLDFTPQRKRSTVVVQEPGEDFVLIIMKGADEAVFPRLEGHSDHPANKAALATSSRLASEGLRVMMVCQRKMPSAEFNFIADRLKEARALPYFHDRTEAIAKIYQELECNMTILGSTGLDDRLQDNVALTLFRLQRCGIKMWVLTGDHMETAKKITFACGLARSNHRHLHIGGNGKNAVNNVDDLRDFFTAYLSDEIEQIENTALYLDGKIVTLLGEMMETDADFAAKCYTFLSQCDVVVVSRTSPNVKNQVVDLVRKYEPSAVTLAIGDGGNDVPMIQAAHVGVGMFGSEGHHAVNASDFAIANFQYLERLLTVHGRANYMRVCKVINYFFYKNICLVTSQFLYALFNSFSGQSLYEGFTWAMYNVIFTFVPCIVMGILDRDVLNTDRAKHLPKIYEYGQQSQGLNFLKFSEWQFEGIVHACVAFLPIMLGNSVNVPMADGKPMDEAVCGLAIYAVIVGVTTAKLALQVRSWTMFHYLGFLGSLAAGFIFYFVYGEIPHDISGRMFRLTAQIGFRGDVWALAIFENTVCILPLVMWWYGSIRIVPFEYLGWVEKAQLLDAQDYEASTRAPAAFFDQHSVNFSIQTSIKQGEVSAQAASAEAELDGSISSSDQPQTKKGHTAMTFQEALLAEEAAERAKSQTQTVGLFDTFRNAEQEEQFRRQHVGNMKRYIVGLCLLGGCSALFFALQFFNEDLLLADNTEAIAYGVLTAISLLTLALFVLPVRAFQRFSRVYYHSVFLVFALIMFSCISISNLRASQRDRGTHPVFLAVSMIGILVLVQPPVPHATQYMAVAIISYASWYQAYRVKAWQVSDIFIRVLEIAAVAVTGLVTLAFTEMFLRSVFIAVRTTSDAIKQAKDEEDRSFRLLCEVLPETVVTEVRNSNRGLSEFSVYFKEASYLQSDIVKFTNFSSGHDCTIVIEMLNKMFTKFDELVKRLGVEKIKTIGDAYICVAGVPVPDVNHSNLIVQAGLGLVDAVDEMNYEGISLLDKLNLQIRVGVASGRLIGGVVGYNKVAYDCYGEAVETAATLESSGLPSRVQCTPEMANQLQAYFDFEEIDGRYFVDGEIEGPGEEGGPSENAPAALLSVDSGMLQDNSSNQVVVPHSELEDGVEIYNIFNDQDTGRCAAIDRWTNFTGQMGGPFAFEDEYAEKHFRKYTTEVATSRSTVEMLIGATLFAIAGSVLILHSKYNRLHPLVIIFFSISFIHIILWVINGGQDIFDDDEEDALTDEEKLRIQKEMMKGKRDSEPLPLGRGRGSMTEKSGSFHLSKNVRGSSNNVAAMLLRVDDEDSFAKGTKEGDTTANEEGESPEDKEMREKARKEAETMPVSTKLAIGFAYFSASVTWICPLLLLPWMSASEETGTVLVFVVLASNTHLFAIGHIPIQLRLGLGIAQAIILTFEIILFRWVMGTWVWTTHGGDSVGLIVGYIMITFGQRNFGRSVRKNFVAAKALVVKTLRVESVRNSSEKLLYNVLPRSIVKKLKSSVGQQIVEEYEDSSVMFVYMSSVDEDRTDAVSAMHDLNNLIWTLDKVCARFHVEKIKTSPYLVVSGVPERSSNHAERLVGCAAGIMAAVHRHNKEFLTDVKVRIGVNTGKICAGVLGNTKLQFDIFGDTVNVASRITSSADWGNVHISTTTNAKIQNKYDCEDMGMLTLKGKGDQHVYRLKLDSSLQGAPYVELGEHIDLCEPSDNQWGTNSSSNFGSPNIRKSASTGAARQSSRRKSSDNLNPLMAQSSLTFAGTPPAPGGVLSKQNSVAGVGELDGFGELTTEREATNSRHLKVSEPTLSVHSVTDEDD